MLLFVSLCTEATDFLLNGLFKICANIVEKILATITMILATYWHE
jgi:hypothetical protein